MVALPAAEEVVVAAGRPEEAAALREGAVEFPGKAEGLRAFWEVAELASSEG